MSPKLLTDFQKNFAAAKEADKKLMDIDLTYRTNTEVDPEQVKTLCRMLKDASTSCTNLKKPIKDLVNHENHDSA